MCQLCIQNALQTWERNEAVQPGEVPISTGHTVWSTAQVIDQIDSGYHWSGSTITFTFPQNTAFFPYSNSEANGFSPFNAKQTDAARQGMELWDDLMAPSFVEITSSFGADIEFSNTTTSIGYAHAYFPGGWSGAGSIWLNPNYGSLNDPDSGEYGYMALLHEIGHALGMNHAGNYNGGNPSYANDASHAQDTHMYTIMSYFDAENTGADWYASDGRWYYPQTPMLHDVLAIQAAYGADMTTRTDDTTYGFNSNAGNDVFDFTQNDHPVLTIWDAGGTDTLDLSGFSHASIINLAPGSYSDADAMTNNIAIAYDAWIENAVGGAGNDVITGNVLDNVLDGGAGADQMYGGMGDDTYFVDDANDVAVEVIGEGVDHVFSSVTIELRHHTHFLERLTLTGTDNIGGTGNGINNWIAGNSGDNILNGAWGDDTLVGRNGNDTFRDDNGADAMHGGAGNDVYYVDNAGDLVFEVIGDGIDHVFSSIAIDLRDHSHFLERLTLTGSGDIDGTGSGINNWIAGNSGDNVLNGAWGDDTLIGGPGNDTFRDDFGNDIFRGGLGSDTFVFLNEFGVDTILDFDTGAATDIVNLTQVEGIVSFADLQANHLGSDQSGFAVITDGANSITLENVSVASLSEDDFIFV